jgi:hypothetical protein
MLNLTRNEDSTIHVPITIDPDSSYTVGLENKLSCQKTSETKQGDMCGTYALFVLNTDRCAGEYWLTIVNEEEEIDFKTTVVVNG